MRPIGKYSGISRVEERSRPSAGAGSREDSADFRLFINPIVLGAGTPYFPRLDEKIDLEFIESRTFGSRVVYVRYRRV